jgi:hypothetical protein
MAAEAQTVLPDTSHRRQVANARIAVLSAVSLALLSCLPVLVARYPQMGDYPAHLARYHVMLDAMAPQGDRSFWLTRYYSFDWWWSGNVGVDLLIRPLTALFGLEQAGRIIAGTIPALTGLGIVTVEWVLRRRAGFGSILAFAFIWSPALLLGFLNFTLSLALALFAFAAWVVLEGRRWRAALFLPIAVLVWLCHVSGWGILGLMVLGYEWERRPSPRAVIAPWPLALPILPLLLGGGTKGMVSYGAYVQIYKLAIWTKAMRDRYELLDLGSLGLVAVIIAAAVLYRRIDWRLGWGALIICFGSIAMPRHIAGGDYADYRMISSGLMLACLAIDWRPPRLICWLAPALFLARLGVTTGEWQAGSRETERLLTVLDHIPEGARVASAVAVERAEWQFNAYEHIGGYAVVRRDALVNANFALPHVHMLHVRDAAPGFADPSQRLFHYPDTVIDLSHFAPADRADFLWYVGAEEPAKLPRGARVIYRTPHALLASLAKPRRRR